MIATGGLIWIVKFFSNDAVRFITRTLKFEVPAAVGIPLMTPPEDNVNPAGKFPCPATRIHA